MECYIIETDLALDESYKIACKLERKMLKKAFKYKFEKY